MSCYTKWLLSDVNILIVDDDEVFSRRLETYLSRQGANVSVLKDGYQVMEACLYGKPNVIFVDLALSSRDGLELIKFLGEGPWVSIAMSARSNLDEIRQALRFGACDFLLKPFFDFELLVEIIQTNIAQLPQVKDDLQRAQLQEHFDFYKGNDVAASQLLAQMLPISGQQVGRFLYLHQLTGGTILPVVASLDEHRTALAIIDFSLSGDEIAVAAVVLHSLLQQAWTAYQSHEDSSAAHPHILMGQLNELVHQSGIHVPIGMAYMVFEQQTIYSVNAGLLDIQPAFPRPDVGLGMVEHVNYATQSGKLDPHGFHILLVNQSGDRLSLKLSPMTP